MSSATPPNPYFSGINFNPSFFTVISGYLTETIANSKYLRLIGGTLSGFLGIKRTARVELDVNGKAVINDATNGVPANGILGSTGTKLILTEGTASETPIAIGSSSDGMWMGTNSTTGISFYTGLSHRMRIKNNGYVGIGTTDAKSLLTVNNFPAITNAFDFSVTPTTITNTTPTSTTVLNDPLPTLFLCREGTVTQAYASRATFSLCRWENNGNNSRTRLDIGVSHAQFDNVNIMSLRSDGAVSIGTTTPQSTNTKLTISGSSTGYSQPLVQITQTNPLWDGNYALQVTGYTNLGGFRINANDGGNSIYQTLLNKDIGIAQFPDNGNTGNISTTTFGSGAIKFFTNGNNERMIINSSGNIGIGTTNPSTYKLYTNGSSYFSDRISSVTSSIDNPLYITSTASGANNCIQIKNNGSIQTFFGVGGSTMAGTYYANNAFWECAGGSIILNVNGGSSATPKFIIKNPDGNIGIGTSDPGTNKLYVNGNLAVNGNITISSGNSFNNGSTIAWGGKFRNGGGFDAGYYIDTAPYLNSLLLVAFTHNSLSYTYFHGHISVNNTGFVIDIINFTFNNMTVEHFIEASTLKNWIRVIPSVGYTAGVNLTVKIYG